MGRSEVSAGRVHEYYRRLVDHSPDAICVHEAGRVVYLNPAGMRWIGAESSAQLVGHPITTFVEASSVPQMLQRIAALREQGDASEPSEAVMLRFDGGRLPVEAVSVLTVWEGRPAFQVVFRDLSVQKAAQAKLRRAEQHLRTVVNSLAAGVLVISRHGRVVTANPAARRLLGIGEGFGEGWGRTVDARTFPLYDTAGNPLHGAEHPIAGTLSTGQPRTGYVCGVDGGGGARVWLSGSVVLLNPDNGPSSPVLVSFTDITEQRAAQQRLAHQATHDDLTGLPNRAHALSTVDAALRNDGSTALAALLFIDLDRLKLINDSLGHTTGDRVLTIAGQRMQRTLRHDDLVCRLGGDEFLVLLSGGTDTDVDQLAQRLHHTLAEPIAVEGHTLTLTASIGVVLPHKDTPRAADLLRAADTAMYDAKTAGGNRTQHFHHTP